MRSEADLTSQARIRDAALVRFGADGFAGTSVRSIAADAGVSPALVLHHFGSKEGLRTACDEHVVGFFEDILGRGVAYNARFDPQAKGLGEWLRSRHIDIPEALLP